MLDIDAPGIIAGKVSNEPFVRRRVLEGIDAQNREQGVGTSLKPRGLDLLGVLIGIPREHQFPAYQGILLEHLPIGVFMPLRRDSRIPGTDKR